MHPLTMLQALALLTLANGAPVVAKRLFGAHFTQPVDAGVLFFDGRPVFGPSKTIRGILAALLATTAGATLLGLSPAVGALVASGAMAGDLLSSFTKRRWGRRPSSRALGLDQVPESLLPLWACRGMLGLTAADVALAVAIFFVGEVVLSRLLYKAHLRDEPY
ncbi:MAG TPA: CDP-archaeol synthase [Stellaceae bacterium]|nr:CDP-archaeol synthase [Stellaceae bacterium]